MFKSNHVIIVIGVSLALYVGCAVPLIPVSTVVRGTDYDLTVHDLENLSTDPVVEELYDLVPRPREFEIVEYAEVDGLKLNLSILRSQARALEEQPMPVIVYVHGGGWKAPMSTYAPINLYFAQRGYFTVNFNYSLSSQNIFPAQIYECKALIRWLRANADRYNIDPNRIGVWGSSAGGHLASLLGTTVNTPAYEGDVGTTGYSSEVAAVVDLYGPTDFYSLIEDRRSSDPGYDVETSAEYQLIGGSLDENRVLVEMANPVLNVTADDPPFLIIHGLEDSEITYSQSVLLYDRMKEVGVESTLILVDGAGHGFLPPCLEDDDCYEKNEGTFIPDIDELRECMGSFFDLHLRGVEPEHKVLSKVEIHNNEDSEIYFNVTHEIHSEYEEGALNSTIRESLTIGPHETGISEAHFKVLIGTDFEQYVHVDPPEKHIIESKYTIFQYILQYLI